jgi:hypothetical protein
MNAFKFTFATEPQPEKKLKVQSSVYPENHGSIQHYNEAWESIHAEAYNAYRERNLNKHK